MRVVTCVHAYSHTAAVRLFSDSDRVLLAVGRETSGPASELRAPAGSGSGMMQIHMSHPGMPSPARAAGARRATPTAPRMFDRSQQRAGAVQA